jgi:hypothetical protein
MIKKEGLLTLVEIESSGRSQRGNRRGVASYLYCGGFYWDCELKESKRLPWSPKKRGHPTPERHV